MCVCVCVLTKIDSSQCSRWPVRMFIFFGCPSRLCEANGFAFSYAQKHSPTYCQLGTQKDVTLVTLSPDWVSVARTKSEARATDSADILVPKTSSCVTTTSVSTVDLHTLQTCAVLLLRALCVSNSRLQCFVRFACVGDRFFRLTRVA